MNTTTTKHKNADKPICHSFTGSRGYRAFKNSEARESNPFKSVAPRTEWFRGYDLAKLQQECEAAAEFEGPVAAVPAVERAKANATTCGDFDLFSD